MGTFSVWQVLRRLVCPASPAQDCMLDDWIHEALLEDACAQPPQGTWDRLRMILERRRASREGMWVLEEPMRDPPDMLPTMLNHHYMRAHQLYLERRYNMSFHLKTHTFTNLFFPTFSALIHY